MAVLVAGSLSLIGGDPGVGKSALLLMALSIAEGCPHCMSQEKNRRGTLGADRLMVNTSTSSAGRDRLIFLAAASCCGPECRYWTPSDTLFTRSIRSRVNDTGTRGRQSLDEFRSEPAFRLFGWSRHQTGAIAGPKVLEHLVDTVIYFEGDGSSQLRALRAVKNRFGSTGEWDFRNDRESLEEVPDASARLLAERVQGASGTTVLGGMEGSGSVLAEVQALVGSPALRSNRLGNGPSRMQCCWRCWLKMATPYDRDVFISAAGGLRIPEPAADLAIAPRSRRAFVTKPSIIEH